MKKPLFLPTAALLLVCTLLQCFCGMADATAAAGVYGSFGSGEAAEWIFPSPTPLWEQQVAFEYILEGLTIDKLATRSGPSTQYSETGTYKVKGEYVRLLSFAYDRSDVCWIQCEVPYRNKLRRVYTGLKRFDTTTFDLNSVPEEDPLEYPAVVGITSWAMYGPGKGYDIYDRLMVEEGQDAVIIAIENGYAQVEWQTAERSYRAWVPLYTLEY